MANKRLVAVVVRGEQNDTRITYPQELTQAALNGLACFVAGKDPTRTYYVMSITKQGYRFVKHNVLYVWHVGDGFEHHEGWWIDADTD